MAGVMGAALALAIVAGVAGCKAKTATVSAQESGDPAAANMAPADEAGQVDQSYPQQAPAPVERSTAEQTPDQNADQGYADDQDYDTDVDQDAVDAGEQAMDETDVAPPELPDYDQPPAPDPGYLWTPGYWGWAPAGYYWVPGVWVAAPYPGALWTPGYWNFYGNRYHWHRGYWGRHVGYYGGIDYGFGYNGVGYYGGYWNGSNFYYNTNITHVNRNVIHNVYTHAAPRPAYGGYARVAFAGGQHGVPAKPRPAEVAAMREHHTPALSAQVQFRQQAAQNHAQFFNTNHGRPQTVVQAHGIQVQHVAPPAQGHVAPRPANNRGSQNGFQPNNGGQAVRNAQQQEQLQQQNMNNMRMQQQQQAQPSNRQPAQPNNQQRPAQSNMRPQQNHPQGQAPPQNVPSNQAPHNNVRERMAQPQGQQPQARPQTQQRPPQNNMRPENHPAPQQRPAPAMQQRPAMRPQRPAPQAHPAPQQHEEHR